MNNALTKTLALTFTLAALTLVGVPTKWAQAGENWCPLNFSDCSPVEQAFYITFSPITLPITSVGLTTIALKNHKVALAQAAIEDVAVYYGSGRITGVLSAVLGNTKLVIAQERGVSATEITEAVAVDHIAGVAESVLN